MTSVSQVFDAKSLAARWGCNRDGVYALVKSGQLRPFNIAPPGAKRQTWRFREDEVRRFESVNPTANTTPTRRKSRFPPLFAQGSLGSGR